MDRIRYSDIADGVRWTDANRLPPWYDYRTEITSVIINDGITSVGECAFVGCENLKSVQLGQDVKEICQDAFFGTGLEEISLPDSLRNIHVGAFQYTPLREVVLPDSLIDLGEAAFANCPELTSVTIGKDTRLNFNIWNDHLTFSNERGEVSDSFVLRGYQNSLAQEYAHILGIRFEIVGETEWDAAGYCGDDLFWSIDLDTGFLLIDGSGPMWDFNGTWQDDEANDAPPDPNLTLPPWTDYRDYIQILCVGNGVTTIGENAFENCHSLSNVYFGTSLEHISFQAFLDTNLDEVYLPDNVTSIDSFAFNYCQNLRQIRLPYELEFLQHAVFNMCTRIESIWIGPDTVLENEGGRHPFNNAPWEMEMSMGMTIYSTRGSSAYRFALRYGLNFVTGIDGHIAEVSGQCGDDVYWFISQGNLILYGAGETWVYDVTPEDRADWALENYPESWLHEGLPDFYEYRDQIHRIYIMPGITNLNHDLFHDMTALGRVDLGTTVETLIHTFFNCSMTDIELPESVISVGPAAFGYCSNLFSVTIHGAPVIGGDAFIGCNYLQEVHFLSGEEQIDGQNLHGVGHSDSVPHSDLTFFVREGSDAERYAQQHNINCVIIEE